MVSISGNTGEQYYLVVDEGGIAEQRVVYELPLELFQKVKLQKFFGAGGGTQIKLGISVSWYEKMGLLKDIK